MRLFSAAEIRALLDMPACMREVEESFRRLSTEGVAQPGVLGFESGPGGFHLKAALSGDGYFAAKINGNFPGNPGAGLPTIQGLIVLCDAGMGRPQAVLESGELTARRTGAATGVAVKHLTEDQPLTVTILGAGAQAAAQLEAVAAVRAIARLFVVDQMGERASDLAARCNPGWHAESIPLDRKREATLASNLVITCTPSRTPILNAGDVSEGCTIAAVGADNPHKNEIHPDLMKRARIITDLTAQCAVLGDLHHALAAGTVQIEDVSAELGQVVRGSAIGRIDRHDVVVFDSTGHALQDVLCAALVYRRSQEL